MQLDRSDSKKQVQTLILSISIEDKIKPPTKIAQLAILNPLTWFV